MRITAQNTHLTHITYKTEGKNDVGIMAPREVGSFAAGW